MNSYYLKYILIALILISGTIVVTVYGDSVKEMGLSIYSIGAAGVSTVLAFISKTYNKIRGRNDPPPSPTGSDGSEILLNP